MHAQRYGNLGSRETTSTYWRVHEFELAPRKRGEAFELGEFRACACQLDFCFKRFCMITGYRQYLIAFGSFPVDALPGNLVFVSRCDLFLVSSIYCHLWYTLSLFIPKTGAYEHRQTSHGIRSNIFCPFSYNTYASMHRHSGHGIHSKYIYFRANEHRQASHRINAHIHVCTPVPLLGTIMAHSHIPFKLPQLTQIKLAYIYESTRVPGSKSMKKIIKNISHLKYEKFYYFFISSKNIKFQPQLSKHTSKKSSKPTELLINYAHKCFTLKIHNTILRPTLYKKLRKIRKKLD